jgi:hypothetical protein
VVANAREHVRASKQANKMQDGIISLTCHAISVMLAPEAAAAEAMRVLQAGLCQPCGVK